MFLKTKNELITSLKPSKLEHLWFASLIPSLLRVSSKLESWRVEMTGSMPSRWGMMTVSFSLFGWSGSLTPAGELNIHETSQNNIKNFQIKDIKKQNKTKIKTLCLKYKVKKNDSMPRNLFFARISYKLLCL